MPEIEVGTITKTRGLKGEVRLFSLASHREELYAKGKVLVLSKGTAHLKVVVSSYRVLPQGEFVTFEGFDDINAILPWIGARILVRESDLVQPEKGEYYFKDLYGMKCFQSDREVGEVCGIRNYPAGDYIVIEKPDHTTALVPFRNEFVTVDLDKKRIDIVTMEGLL